MANGKSIPWTGIREWISTVAALIAAAAAFYGVVIEWRKAKTEIKNYVSRQDSTAQQLQHQMIMLKEQQYDQQLDQQSFAALLASGKKTTKVKEVRKKDVENLRVDLRADGLSGRIELVDSMKAKETVMAEGFKEDTAASIQRGVAVFLNPRGEEIIISPGKVFRQDPKPGTEMPIGGSVTIMAVKPGPERIPRGALP